MSGFLHWLFKAHDWFYKGDGLRICMMCGRRERDRNVAINYTTGGGDHPEADWRCIKRGDETKRCAAVHVGSDRGPIVDEEGPKLAEKESDRISLAMHKWIYPLKGERWCSACKKREQRAPNNHWRTIKRSDNPNAPCARNPMNAISDSL